MVLFCSDLDGEFSSFIALIWFIYSNHGNNLSSPVTGCPRNESKACFWPVIYNWVLASSGVEGRGHLNEVVPLLNGGAKSFLLLDLIIAAAAKSLQSCLTLCDPIDGSPPGSAVPGILQARTLEWVAISFSNAWKWKQKVKLLSRVRLLGTPWTVAHRAPPSMGVSRQEYWSGVPLPSPKHSWKHSNFKVLYKKNQT